MPELPEYHSMRCRLILRACVGALMEKRLKLALITRTNYAGQPSSGAWACRLPTMQLLNMAVLEAVVLHSVCTPASWVNYG